jgi:exopolyphosphatase/guanosine-5'-triphosphate,3'-diphosphate pyrophosphatase
VPSVISNCQRRAVIDIGTNSVKLLVADVHQRIVRPVLEQSRQTRLGSGFYESHRLQPDAIQRTAGAVADFAAEARKLAATTIRVIATSAARDARNPTDLNQAIHATCGLDVEVISGEQEAAWAHAGVTTDERFLGQPLCVLDVGGGSTEVVATDGRTLLFTASHPLGTVRWIERHPHSDLPTPEERVACLSGIQDFLGERVTPALAPVLKRLGSGAQLVGTGGTATILARIEHAMEGFDRDRIETTRLTRADLGDMGRRLWSLPLADRRVIPGLPANRADVILAGVAIYESVMSAYNWEELLISTRGLRHAALLPEASA